MTEVGGAHLYSEGRYRSEWAAKTSDLNGNAFGSNTEGINAWDGQSHDFLRNIESNQKGFIDPSPLGMSSSTGAWLLTGEINESWENRPNVDRDSIFSDILQYGNPETLVAELVEMEDETDVYHLVAELPWGKYELWIDPARGYNLVKAVMVFDQLPDDYGADTVRYELESVDLVQVDDVWIPEASKFRVRKSFEQGSLVTESDITVVFSDVELLTGDEPDSLFSIDWPANITIKDRVLGITYGRDEEHPLDSLLTDLDRDADWVAENGGDEAGSSPVVARVDPADAKESPGEGLVWWQWATLGLVGVLGVVMVFVWKRSRAEAEGAR